MSHIRPLAFLVALMFVACFTLACGSSGSMSGRQLQSITLNAVGDCCESAFTATGDYSASPSTVTPLPTSWSIGTPPAKYQLTTQTFTVTCLGVPPETYLVTAMSPVNPNAPSSGPVAGTKMVVATTQVICQ